jgi:hypothetical protein
VCFAAYELGLSYRSRIFGINFGLGITATTSLVNAAWLAHNQINSLVNIVNGTAICVALIIWLVYFLVPELERRPLDLPATSPFHRWNEVSLTLGFDPGYVVVSSDTW